MPTFVLLLVGITLAAEAQAPTPADLARARYESEVQSHLGDACLLDLHCIAPLRCEAEACAEPGGMSGTSSAVTPQVRFYADNDQPEYWLELATQPWERQRGLMFRPVLLDTWGMLFIFPDDAERSFWMQNTFIALDMVFVDVEGTVVGVVENATPLTTDSRAVPGESRYVIELAAGQAEAHGIRAGVRIEMLNLPADLDERVN